MNADLNKITEQVIGAGFHVSDALGMILNLGNHKV